MVSELNHRLASYFKVLSNALRIEALVFLREEDEAYLKQIAEEIGRDPGVMSRHMNALADYDLTRAETRGRKKYFTIKREDLVDDLLNIRSHLKRPDDDL